jgi:ferrochelatase
MHATVQRGASAHEELTVQSLAHFPWRPSGTSQKTGVLLLNIGTPNSTSLEDVREYLGLFLGDNRVLELKPAPLKWLALQLILLTRPKQAQEAYKSIWDPVRGSPLLFHTEDLQEGLQQRLGPEFEVKIGFLYSNPSIVDAMQEFSEQGIDNVMLAPMFPQYASSTTGAGLEAVYKIASSKYCTPYLSVLRPYYDNPEYIAAQAMAIEKCVGSQAKDVDHLLFSFHGLPEDQCTQTDDSGKVCLKSGDCCESLRFENRNCYRAQCYDTARLLAAHMSLPDGKWSVSFQSRLTLRDTIKWIEPYTDEAFEKLGKRGIKKLGVAAPAFTADCVETLEELGDEGVEQFKDAGGEELLVIPCLNSSEPWIQAFANIISAQLGRRPQDAGAVI